MESELKNSRARFYAKILAVLNSLIALPALFFTATSVLLFLMSLDNLNSTIYPLVFSLGVWLATIIGLVLLFGYWRHAFGKLSAAKSNLLWKGTIIYNAVLLIGVSAALWLTYSDAKQDSAFFVYLVVNFLYCAAAIVLSVFALRDDLP